jgi:hypothetical protein
VSSLCTPTLCFENDIVVGGSDGGDKGGGTVVRGASIDTTTTALTANTAICNTAERLTCAEGCPSVLTAASAICELRARIVTLTMMLATDTDTLMSSTSTPSRTVASPFLKAVSLKDSTVPPMTIELCTASTLPGPRGGDAGDDGAEGGGGDGEGGGAEGDGGG